MYCDGGTGALTVHWEVEAVDLQHRIVVVVVVALVGAFLMAGASVVVGDSVVVSDSVVVGATVVVEGSVVVGASVVVEASVVVDAAVVMGAAVVVGGSVLGPSPPQHSRLLPVLVGQQSPSMPIAEQAGFDEHAAL